MPRASGSQSGYPERRCRSSISELTRHSTCALTTDHVCGPDLQRALPGTIRHAMHSQARLLFSHDDSIASWLERTERIGRRDQAYQLLRDALGLPYQLEKAEKWLYVKRDTGYYLARHDCPLTDRQACTGGSSKTLTATPFPL